MVWTAATSLASSTLMFVSVALTLSVSTCATASCVFIPYLLCDECRRVNVRDYLANLVRLGVVYLVSVAGQTPAHPRQNLG
jgi:hypothetical protein